MNVLHDFAAYFTVTHWHLCCLKLPMTNVGLGSACDIINFDQKGITFTQDAGRKDLFIDSQSRVICTKTLSLFSEKFREKFPFSNPSLHGITRLLDAFSGILELKASSEEPQQLQQKKKKKRKF